MNNIFTAIFKYEQLSNSIPVISDIRNCFVHAAFEDYSSYMDFLIESNSKKEFENFLYYFLLFRDIPEVQNVLNDVKTPINFIEHLIMYAYGYTAIKGGSIDKVMDELLYFLSVPKMLDLCITSKHLSKDCLFIIFILTKIDMTNIDYFFSRTEIPGKIVKIFCDLPSQMINEIIYRNIDFFEFMRSIIPAYLNAENAGLFVESYKETIKLTFEINNLIKLYNAHTRNTAAKDKTDFERLAILVSIIEKYDAGNLNHNGLEASSLLVSNNEMLLAYEISTNPLYSDILIKIQSSSFFDQCLTEESSVEIF